MFENVYGYKNVKKELMLLKDWYSDATILDNPKITLPRGVLLYGAPGNGKTLLMREFLDSFDCPKYVLGEEDEADETNYYHRHTQKTEARIEKKTYRLIHRFKRQTKRYLKHHKGDLRKTADFIMKEGELTHNDFATLGLSI